MSRFESLRAEVCRVNRSLVEAGLVVLTWGNASGADRTEGVMAIKPSGVPYERLTSDDMIVLAIASGEVIQGKGRPSSDTPTHLHLYRAFGAIGGVVHTHSDFATSFAQAGCDIPCMGTTHADNFYGCIPCTQDMSPREIAENYELNTGLLISGCFETRGINPMNTPGVLVKSHAPFAWGSSPAKALENAIVMEYVAKMCLQTMQLNPKAVAIGKVLMERHFLRKHGANAYYGQPNR
ncbi:MAG: L-ribulose-5-phosphate 4-epimerase AraD [Phycisphaerae bacterium]